MADNDPNNENPGDLRNQRDQLARDKEELTQRLAQFEQREQLREAGLGHLSARQQRSILRELSDDGKDFSKEDALAVAEELGFKTSAEPTPTPTPPPTDSNGNGDTPPATPPGGGSDDSEDALTAMALMERARAAAAGNLGTSDFEQEIRKTNSAAELTNLVRTKGARHNIVHEWDVP